MKPTLKDYLFLHGLLFLYSLGSIASKAAAGQALFSLPFFALYGLMLFDLALYALLWQQILKRMPLTTAFANKAVVTVWGLLWSVWLFHEPITWNMVVGCVFILFGIVMVVKAND